MEPSYGQWPPGVVRSEIIFNGATGALLADTGKIVTSMSRGGAGLYALILNKDLGSLNFWGCVIGTSTADRMASYAFTQATNTLDITVSDAAGSDADSAIVTVIILCGTPGAAA